MARGNPNFGKKKIEKETENIVQEINVDELVAKAVAEALAKQKAELLSQIPIEQEKPKKIKHRFIPEHARIRLQTNVEGKFIITDTRGQSFFYELNGYRDSLTVSFKELKNYYGKNYVLFTSGKLAITDVTVDVEVELDDVIRDLNLTNIYFNEKKISPIEIEKLFSNAMDIKEFEDKVRNSSEVAETIVEVGHILYKRSIFTDNTKMNFLRQQFRDTNLFTR
jgi:hypothetical protein